MRVRPYHGHGYRGPKQNTVVASDAFCWKGNGAITRLSGGLLTSESRAGGAVSPSAWVTTLVRRSLGAGPRWPPTSILKQIAGRTPRWAPTPGGDQCDLCDAVFISLFQGPDSLTREVVLDRCTRPGLGFRRLSKCNKLGEWRREFAFARMRETELRIRSMQLALVPLMTA
jgi:hypothetical protein